jgi:hypothetical protein
VQGLLGTLDEGVGSNIHIYQDATGKPYLYSSGSIARDALFSSVSLVQDEWTHLTFIFSPNGRRIYTNGVLTGSDSQDTISGTIGFIGRRSSYY